MPHQIHHNKNCQKDAVVRTRLSSPPPRRSMPPMGMEGTCGGPEEVGGARSRLSRSPSRSPWEGMTAGGGVSGTAPTAWLASGLSLLSPLQRRIDGTETPLESERNRWTIIVFCHVESTNKHHRIKYVFRTKNNRQITMLHFFDKSTDGRTVKVPTLDGHLGDTSRELFQAAISQLNIFPLLPLM